MLKKYRDAKRARGECLNDKRKARPGKIYCDHCAKLSNERGGKFRSRSPGYWKTWKRNRQLALLPYLESISRILLGCPVDSARPGASSSGA